MINEQEYGLVYITKGELAGKVCFYDDDDYDDDYDELVAIVYPGSLFGGDYYTIPYEYGITLGEYHDDPGKIRVALLEYEIRRLADEKVFESQIGQLRNLKQIKIWHSYFFWMRH